MTGQPRPPTAPRSESTAERATPPGAPTTEVVVPTEMGPPLEWCEESRTFHVQGSIFMFGFALFAFVVVYRGFGWVSEWFPWVFAAVMAVLIYRKIREDRVIAGAQWIQQRDKWVSTYELTKIRSTTVWDLVYNGIVHSVASGNCDISKAARRILKI